MTITPVDLSQHVSKVAKSVKLVPVEGINAVQTFAKDHQGQDRSEKWIEAVVRESLMEQKYLTASRVVAVPIKSSFVTFRIKELVASTKVTASRPSTSGLAGRMEELSLSSSTTAVVDTVMMMNWKTEIDLSLDVVPPGPSNEPAVNKVRATSTTKLQPTALPSYIQIFPPGPLVSQSASFSAYATLGGLTPQISQIRSLLDLPLSHPEVYQQFGLKPPRGILLYGPPGTGKTHLARAISSETPGCSCIVVNGPELSSAFHGETEERVRAVFEEARRREPCIIVLDEVDAICPKREGGEGGEVERRVVATLLTLMDGMSEAIPHQPDSDSDKTTSDLPRVVVIAATNRPNALDPALRRPGRFDREIEIGIPDSDARYDILSILVSRIPQSIPDQELRSVADRTHGYVGADVSALVREAGSRAIRRWMDQKSSDPADSADKPCMTTSDLTESLPTIRPSAMREIFFGTTQDTLVIDRWSTARQG